MKAIYTMWRWGLPVMLATVIGTALGQVNNCIPTVTNCSPWSCTVGSVNNSGTLSPTNFTTICRGESVSVTVTGTTFNDGNKSQTCSDDCGNQWGTSLPITYTPLYVWTPALPSIFTNTGTYYFTNEVEGISQDPDCTQNTAFKLVGVLTVIVTNSPPVIITQPTNQTVAVGDTAVFSVLATGCPTVTYQWYFNTNTLLAGQTNSILILSDVQTTNAGYYSVVVSDYSSSITSSQALLTVYFASCASVPPSIISWWPGDGNADDIIGTNNGILDNGVTFTNGVVGQAFHFNGTNQDVRIPYSTSLEPTNVTVECWVKLDSLTSAVASSPGLQYIVFKQNSRSGNFEGYDLEKNRISGQDVFRFKVTSAGGTQVPATATTIPQPGVWYHLAGTYDGTTVKIYVNGVLQGTATAGFPLNYGTEPVYFGTTGQSFDGRLEGALDEVSIYGQALSSNQIDSIYLAGAAGKCASCYPIPASIVAWWPGQSNYDDVIGGNDGIVTNGAVGFAPAEVGAGFNFTGGSSNRLIVPDAPALDIGSNIDFTIETWIRAYSNTMPQGVLTIADKRYAPNNFQCQGYEFSLFNGQLNLRISANSSGNGTSWSGGPYLLDGQLHHVAVTVMRDSTNGGNFYVDGTNILQFNPTSVEGDLTTTQPLRIGNHPDLTDSAFFKGQIDELSIYKRALSSNEIAGIFLAGPEGKCSSSCDPPPSGIVSWWPGEGNANDIIGPNNGILEGSISFGSGEVGEAFKYTTTNDTVRVPASSSLNVGTGGGFTVEAWINPSDVSVNHCIFEWNNGTNFGTHFYITGSPALGTLYANVVDNGGSWHQMNSSVSPVITNAYQHVALTYDKASGTATMYYNGSMVGQQNLGSYSPQTSYDLYLGRRPPGIDSTWTFSGLIDEPTLYNRALSSNEIAAIYGAGPVGKCRETNDLYAIGPTNITTCPGESAPFSVEAGGCSPITYQWDFGTNALIGQTNSSLALTNVYSGNGGTYSVIVSSTCGSLTNSATLTVLTNLTVAGPEDLSVCAGATAVFGVTAFGTGPFSYQWSFGTNDLAGRTNSTLTISNVSPANVGAYSIMVSGACGIVIHSAVLSTLSIVTQPGNQTIAYGQSATFSVSAIGYDSPVYQWQKNGINIPGANASLYTVVQPVVAQSGDHYDVVVSSPYCTLISSNATLVVNPAPLLISADDKARPYGTTNPPLTWTGFGFVNGDTSGVLTGNASLTCTAATNSPVGNYPITISQGTLYGANYSLSFSNSTMAVAQAVLDITADNKSRQYGTTNPPLTWTPTGFLNGDTSSVLSGQPTLSCAATTNSPVGDYPIVITVGTLACTNYSFLSSNGLLAVTQTPLTVTASNQFKITGSPNPTLTGVLAGVKNNDNITATYSTTAVTTSPAGTYPIVPALNDPAGKLPNYNVTTNDGTLTVTDAPVVILISPPATVTVNAGGAMSIGVVAGGTPALSYQWYFNGTTPIPGATGTNYTKVGLQPSDDGLYSVFVSNSRGGVMSSSCTLTVYVPPFITLQPTNQIVARGNTATFSVQVIGTPMPSYQWHSNGVSIAGATLSSYSTPNPATYSVVVANAAGSVASLSATLTDVGVNEIIINGSNPVVQGGSTNLLGTVNLLALSSPSGMAYPVGYPIWITTPPIGGPVTNTGTSQITVTNSIAGQYIITASCGTNQPPTFVLLSVDPNADSDYDGVNDWQEILDGTDPNNPNSVLPRALGSWLFDDTNHWYGLQGQVPLVVSNIVGCQGVSSNGMRIDTTNNALLVYRESESGANVANINCRQGSVSFWFSPDWTSGTNGPQTGEARLLEFGKKGTTNGCWGLYLNNRGTNIYFCTQTNTITSVPKTNLIAQVNWSSNYWHFIALTYNSNNCSLYLDGVLCTNGLGVTNWPSLPVRTNGFCIGSCRDGTNQACGRFDNLGCHNYCQNSNDIAIIYSTACFSSLDVMLCLDTSGSMTQTNGTGNSKIADVKIAATNFIAHLNFKNDRCGLLTFTNNSKIWNSLTTNFTLLDSNILKLGAAGSTIIENGLTNAALALLTNHVQNASPILVLMTDGSNQPPSGFDSSTNIVNAATWAKGYGIHIITVALGTNADGQALSLSASPPSTNNYFDATNTAILTNVFSSISDMLCRTNENPSVSIVSPTNFQLFNAPSSVPIFASATDPESELQQVEFFWGPGTNVLTATNSIGAVNYTNYAGYYYLPWTNPSDLTNTLLAVVVSGSGLNATSAPVYVIVNDPPVIANLNNQLIIWPDQPANVQLTASVTDDGIPAGGHLSETWALQSSNGPVTLLNPNTTSATAEFVTNGFYSFNLTASDGAAATIGNCTVTIRQRPFVFITWPTNNATMSSSNATINVIAYDYDTTIPTNGVVLWDIANGATNIITSVSETVSSDGSTTNLYCFGWTNNIPLGTNVLYAVATDNYGLTNVSPLVTVVIYQPVLVTLSPQNPTNCPGDDVAFTATVSGTGPLGYSWELGTNVLNGQTTNILDIPNITASSQGFYTVTVISPYNTNVVGTQLTVLPETSAIGPTNDVVYYGGTASFATTPLSGVPPFNYQWYSNSVPLAGQTASTLTFTNAINNAAYSVVIGSARCGVITNSATLTIIPPPTIYIVQPPNNARETAFASLQLMSVVQDQAAVTNVVYSTNGVGFATNSVSPYLLNLSGLLAGTYVFQATAYDIGGRIATSPTVTNVVIKSMPFIQIFEPSSSNVFVLGQNIPIGAKATDSGGTITNVQFQLAGTTANVPSTSVVSGDLYYTTWTNAPLTAPNYTNIYAIAMDDQGSTATSMVSVVVQQACDFAAVSNLFLSVTQALAGEVVYGTVVLSNAAPEGGEAVNLSSSSALVTVPSFVIVPENATTATFDIETVASSATNMVTVGASYHGQDPAVTNVLTVLPGTGSSTSDDDTNQSPGIWTTNLNSLTPEDMVREIVGPEVAFSNVRYTGATNAAGIFHGGNGIIGFEGGIILCSGDITNVIGPNNSSGASCVNGLPGDADLNALVEGTGSTADASVLEFDFVPQTETVTWDYVFGSEEYNEFVGAYNDVFGFFLNGTNVALLPDGSPVSIDNVNNFANSQFYIDNTGDPPYGAGGDPSIAPLNTQMDGLTTVLTVSAHVNPGVVNHIKIAIADTGDSQLDSFVLIRAGSFRTGGTTIYVRDDLNRQYPSFSIVGPMTGNTSLIAGRFDGVGISGTVQGAQIDRAGVFTVTSGDQFDLQLGVQTVSNNVSSFGILFTNAQMTANEHYNAPWLLPASFYNEIQPQLPGICQLSWTNDLSSVCGDSYVVTDEPQLKWPVEKNILTLAILTDRRIPCGRCRDFVLTGIDPPLNGTWDIVYRGQIIASSGDPNGWDVEDDHTIFGGSIVTVPSTATSGDGYEVRALGPDSISGLSATFAVFPSGSIPTAPVLLPLRFSTNIVDSSGSMISLTVALDSPAPFGDAYVTLMGPSVANLPPWVVIPVGQTSITTNIQIGAASPGTLQITASYNGERVAKLAVTDGCQNPGTPQIQSIGTNSLGVLLTWLSAADANGYNVSRSTDDVNFSVIFAGLTTTNFVDTSVSPLVKYYYEVTAVSNACESTSEPTNLTLPYPIAAPAPWIIPDGGIYNDQVAVLITNSVAGSTIYYTTDGTTPTTSSPWFGLGVNSGTIILTSNTLVQAYSVNANYNQPSSIADANFTIIHPMPIDCGSGIASSLLASDSFSAVQGVGYFCSRYIFTNSAAEIGQVVTLTASSSDFYTALYVLDDSTNVLYANFDSLYNGTNSQIAFQITNPGTNVIEVTSCFPWETGNFNLQMDCEAVAGLNVFTNAWKTFNTNYAVFPIGGTLNFGVIPLRTPVTNFVTLTNSGTTDLIISNIAVYPNAISNASDGFTIAPSSMIDIPGGGIANLAISLFATNISSFEGYFIFNDNDGSSLAQNPFWANLIGEVGANPGVPLVTIYFPTNGLTINVTNSIITNVVLEIDAGVIDTNQITKFYFTNALFTVSASRGSSGLYTAFWTNPPAGPQVIQAIAIDQAGNSGTNSVTINVGVPSLTLTPTNPCVELQGGMTEFTATLFNITNGFVAYSNVVFTITGPNGSMVTNQTGVNGEAELSYTGTQPGADRIIASASVAGVPVAVGPIIMNWAAPISCGNTYSGTLTNSSGFSMTDRYHYADYYSFTGTAGTPVRLQLNSSDFSTYMFIITNCVILTNVPVEAFNTNDTLISYTPPANGTYIVEVTSSDIFKMGDYSLTLSCGAISEPQMAAYLSGTNFPDYGLLNFGSALTNVAVTNTLVITNEGNATLDIAGWSFYEGLTNIFSVLNPPVAVVAPGTSTNISIVFMSTNSGQFQDALIFTNNDPYQNPFVVNLGGVANPNNTPPTVNITSPANGAQFQTGNPITILANAYGNNGATITNVTFIFRTTQGAYVIGSTTTPISGTTYSMSWTVEVAGNYSLQAVAYDNDGGISISPAVNITVNPSIVNIPPVTRPDYVTVLSDSMNDVLDVLTNDYSPSGDPLTITAIIPSTTPQPHGTAVIVDNGQHIAYTPPPGYGSSDPSLIEDGFSYQISDGKGGSVLCAVYVSIFATSPPGIWITNPPDGSYVDGGTVIPLVAYVNPYQYVTNVTFYEGQTILGVVTNGPNSGNGYFTNYWTAVNKQCTCKFTAQAEDEFGQVNTSPEISINVTNATGANAPTASLSSYTGYNDTNTSGTLTPDATTSSLFNSVGVTIQSGMFNIFGAATNSGESVTWTLALYSSDGSTLLRTLVPQATNSVSPGGFLATCDLTTIQNGSYQLRLDVVSDGYESESDAQINLDSNLKLGELSFSQQDLVIPIKGIPLTITRTYNSIDPNSADFGYGWTFAINSMNVQLNETRETVSLEPLSSGTANIRSGGGRDVTLTLPDGRTATFNASLVQGGAAFTEGLSWNCVWSAPGVTAKLTTLAASGGGGDLGDNTLIALPGTPNYYWQDGGENSTVDNYDMPGWILTTPDQTQYYITRGNGKNVTYQDPNNVGSYLNAKVYGTPKLTKIVEHSGDSIQIGDNSITHFDPTGKATSSIQFDRDVQSRIIDIRDPGDTNGFPAIKYEYDAVGNLIHAERLADRNAGTYDTNTYIYANSQFPHYITSILNGDGTQVAQNFYDPNSGKLTETIDADGNKTFFSNNPSNNTQTVVDRLNNTNLYVYDSRGDVLLHTDPLGESTTNGFDVNNNIIQTIDPLGNTNTYAYDANNNRTLMVDADNRTNLFTYNSSGELTSQTDPVGNVAVNSFDQNGNLTQAVLQDPNGNVISGYSSSYDNNGLLTQMQDASGQTTAKFGYDPSSDYMTTMTDANGQTHTFGYDADGNKTNSSYYWTPSDGGTPVLVTNLTFYDAQNRVIMTIDSFGNTNQTFYDLNGNISCTIDQYGNTNSFLYDARGNQIATTNTTGTVTYTVYDLDARPILKTDPNGITGTLTEYDAVGRMTNTIRLENIQVNLASDANAPGQMTTIIASLGTALSTNSMIYYANGWIQSQTTPDGTTTYTYWPNGQTKTVTDPMGHTTTDTYDIAGNRSLVWDANNHATRFLYDALGNMVSTIYDNSTSVSNIFNNVGQKIGATDQNGLLTQYGYNVAGQLTNVITPQLPAGSSGWSYQYNLNGQLIVTTDPNNHSTTNLYNAQGDEIAQALPMGQTNASSVYNSFGQLWKEYDFIGQMIEHRYDNFGRETNKAYFATGATTGTEASYAVSYAYNQLNQLTNVTQFYGSSANQFVATLNPSGRGFTSVPLSARLVASLNHYPDFFGGTTVLFMLGMAMAVIPSEKRRRMVHAFAQAWRSSFSRSFRHDAQPKRIRVLSPIWRFVAPITLLAVIFSQPGYYELCTAQAQCYIPNNFSTTSIRITSFTYDFEGNLSQVNSPEGVINYSYDLATGRMTSLCTANSEQDYSYDALGRLQNVTVVRRNGATLTTPETTTYAYDAVGNRSSVSLPNGVVTTYQYDDLNRLTNLTHTAQGGSVLANYEYMLDVTGRRTNAVEIFQQEGGAGYQTNALTWQYDGMYRLTNEINVTTYSGGSYAFTNAYTYDPVGNRLQMVRTGGGVDTKGYSYDSNDELVSTTDNGVTSNYLYDANGSLTNVAAGGTTICSYSYDLANKLNGLFDASGSQQAAYFYDDNGIRVQSIEDNVTNEFLIDDNNQSGYAQVLEELPGLGKAPTMSYVIGDDVIAQSTGSSAPVVSYFLQDGHGNNRQLVGMSGAVSSHYMYDAFGRVQSNVSSTTAEYAASYNNSNVPNVTTKLYCGEQYDAKLQMYNLRARYYDPADGRFNQRDTFAGDIEDPITLHKYLYAGCDPIGRTDPGGQLFGLGDITAAMAIDIILFSLVVGGLDTLIKWGEGMRGWNLLFNFLIVSGTTAGLIFGGLSTVTVIAAAAMFFGFCLLAYAVYYFASKLINGTFNRWDACEVLLFLVSWKVANAKFSAMTGQDPMPAGGDDTVVLQHGTDSDSGAGIMSTRQFDPSKLNEGAVFTTPTPDNMPQGGLLSPHASYYARSRAFYAKNDPVIINLLIPKSLLPSLRMSGKPWGGDEYALDPAKLNNYIKQGKVGMTITKGIKGGDAPQTGD